MLSSWSSSLAIPGSSSRCTLQQQNVIAGSTTPPLAVAAAETARRRRRRSEGFMSIGGAGATRAEIELDQKLHESDQLVQVSSASKDSIKQIRRDAGVALLNKSAATAQTSVKQSLHDTAAVWRTREWLLDEAREIMAQAVDDRRGPPRWYCPVEAAGFPENAPLLLCLPGLYKPQLLLLLVTTIKVLDQDHSFSCTTHERFLQIMQTLERPQELLHLTVVNPCLFMLDS
jgi:hypothetical protein